MRSDVNKLWHHECWNNIVTQTKKYFLCVCSYGRKIIISWCYKSKKCIFNQHAYFIICHSTTQFTLALSRCLCMPNKNISTFMRDSRTHPTIYYDNDIINLENYKIFKNTIYVVCCGGVRLADTRAVRMKRKIKRNTM